MKNEVKILLSALRQAVNTAILGSREVSAALVALGRAGGCPSVEVDVSFREQTCYEPGSLVLTADDHEFLQSLGINVGTAPEAAHQAH